MLRLSLLVLYTCSIILLTYGEEHQHSHESPSFKYSRSANTEGVKTSKMKYNLRVDSPQQLWLETAGAVLLISLAPFLVLFLLPDLNKHDRLLRILLAFAAGGLLGDAFLHLIPHAVDRERYRTVDHPPTGHDHQHHMMVGLCVVAGIFVFLFIEKLIRLVQHHTSCISTQPSTVPVTTDTKTKKNKRNGDETPQRRDKKSSKIVRGIRVTGYLNLAADFTHNFTDGLAIGASFLVSRNLGGITTLTVLFHELPHEIGDYAILIQSGCSARKAMFLQLTTAVGAALGACLSLLAGTAGGLERQTVWGFHLQLLSNGQLIHSCILPFTAGGFIYIAMTSVLPDLLSSPGSETNNGTKHIVTGGTLLRLSQSVAEFLGLVVGIIMMAALGTLE